MRQTSQKRYKYVGKECDNETGLYYYGARYYDPWICRFVSVDPMKDETPNWTPYRYAFNNPLRFFDPDGRTEQERNMAVAEARKRIGTKYGFAAKPKLGETTIDCSGLVRNVISSNNIWISLEYKKQLDEDK